MDITM